MISNPGGLTFGSSRKKPIFPAPVIWDYTDYRVYLQDFLSYKRQSQAGFSVRQFSLKAGISTENYLLKIIRGEKRLGMKLAEVFIATIPLRASAAEYFRTLVLSGLAKNSDELTRAQARLVQLRRKRRDTAPVLDHSILYHWYYSVIWELSACTGFDLTPENIVSAISPRISHQEAKEAIEFLEHKGYVVTRNGKKVQADTPVMTTDGKTDLLLRHHHKENLRNAIEAVDLSIEERGFYGLTIAFNKKRLPEVKKRIKEFMDALQTDLALDPDADMVYRVNSHVYPVAKTKIFRKERLPLAFADGQSRPG